MWYGYLNTVHLIEKDTYTVDEITRTPVPCCNMWKYSWKPLRIVKQFNPSIPEAFSWTISSAISQNIIQYTVFSGPDYSFLIMELLDIIYQPILVEEFLSFIMLFSISKRKSSKADYNILQLKMDWDDPECTWSQLFLFISNLHAI